MTEERPKGGIPVTSLAARRVMDEGPMSWNFRVVVRSEPDGTPSGEWSTTYELIEAYYGGSDDALLAWSDPKDTRPTGDDLDDLRADLHRMLDALERPVIDWNDLPRNDEEATRG